ncbi:hypothetical protein E1295_44325 [Nonomuraea mesophila]|uniref:Uncharacterized protein n=1 Tax=Nonomuraea mesophila TaxID=2530382 RepID=A0A4R5E6K4_9ACTN|nr:hypothetical protein [Nonomuraea mesophila]TDE26423.1 hypothetical protein E1295_44325 [Nonomuraea mesophila]
MGLNRKDFGFWKNIRDMPAGKLFGIEGVFALLLGGVGCGVLIPNTKVSERIAVAGDFLTLVGALLGVMVAAFALVITMLSNEYLLRLKIHPRGFAIFLSPFMVNIGINVGSIILVVMYRAAASRLPSTLEQVLFVMAGISFIFVLLNVVAIARNVLAHGATRADAAELEAMQRMIETRGDEDGK